MSSNHAISAHSRQTSGTGAARAIRREGLIPGVVYGQQQDPELIAVDPKILLKEYHTTGFFSRLFTLTIEDRPQKVLAKDIQIHPVTDLPLHVDFQRVCEDESIKVKVSLVFINEDKCTALKRGAKLNIVRHNLEILCPVGALPEKFVIDLSLPQFAQGVNLENLALGDNIVAVHPERDATLATIAGKGSSAPSTEE